MGRVVLAAEISLEELEALEDGPELARTRGLQDLRGVGEVELRRGPVRWSSTSDFSTTGNRTGCAGQPGFVWVEHGQGWPVTGCRGQPGFCPGRVPWAAPLFGLSRVPGQGWSRPIPSPWAGGPGWAEGSRPYFVLICSSFFQVYVRICLPALISSLLV